MTLSLGGRREIEFSYSLKNSQKWGRMCKKKNYSSTVMIIMILRLSRPIIWSWSLWSWFPFVDIMLLWSWSFGSWSLCIICSDPDSYYYDMFWSWSWSLMFTIYSFGPDPWDLDPYFPLLQLWFCFDPGVPDLVLSIILHDPDPCGLGHFYLFWSDHCWSWSLFDFIN